MPILKGGLPDFARCRVQETTTSQFSLQFPEPALKIVRRPAAYLQHARAFRQGAGKQAQERHEENQALPCLPKRKGQRLVVVEAFEHVPDVIIEGDAALGAARRL